MRKQNRTMSKEARKKISEGMKRRYAILNGRIPATPADRPRRITIPDNAHPGSVILDAVNRSVADSLEMILPDIVSRAIVDAVATFGMSPQVEKAMREASEAFRSLQRKTK